LVGRFERTAGYGWYNSAIYFILIPKNGARIGMNRSSKTRPHLNEYFEGRWKPAKWEPSKAIASCIECHGPEDCFPRYKDGMNHQQGHMECLLCHTDHNK
jgi:hypothetical protein